MSWQSQLLQWNEKRTLKKKRMNSLVDERDKCKPFRNKNDDKWNEYAALSKELVEVEAHITKMKCTLQHPIHSILISIFPEDVISIVLEYDSFCCCSSCFTRMPKAIKYCLPCLLDCCLQVFEFELASFHTLNQNEYSQNELEISYYIRKYIQSPVSAENTTGTPFILFLYFVRGTNEPLRLVFK